MPRPVPRAGRLLDLVGLALFLAGAGVYARAWLGLQRLELYRPPPGAGPFAAVARAEQWSKLSHTGIGLMAAAVVVAITVAVLARRLAAHAQDAAQELD